MFVISLTAIDALTHDVIAHVEAAAYRQYPNATIEVIVNPLDPRLSIPACDDQDLSLQAGRTAPRFAVAVRCHAPRRWTIYISGRTEVQMPVVVTQTAIERGREISASDVALVPRDVTLLHDRYMTDASDAIGKVAKRHLAANAVVTPQQLEARMLVKRGDRVTVRAARSGIQVTTMGEALRDGTLGEQIPVRNESSNRTIHAWVKEAGVVATAP